MSRRKRLILVGLLAVGAMAGFYLWYLASTARVVVARGDIPPYQMLTAQDLEVRRVMALDLHPKAVRRPEEAVGMYTAVPLVGGAPILRPYLVARPQDRGLLIGRIPVPQGQVVVGLPTDLSRAAGGLVEAGSLVHLISVRRGRQPGSEAEGVLFAQKVLVVSVARGEAAGGPRGLPNGVALAVSPELAAEVALRQAEGDKGILLALTHRGAPDLPLPITVSLGEGGQARVGMAEASKLISPTAGLSGP